MGKDGAMPADRVWVEVEVSADKDWQSIVEKSPTKDIRNGVPEDGYYTYPRPMSQGKEWMIAGSMRINRVLTDADVDSLLGESDLSRPARRGGDIDLAQWGLDTSDQSIKRYDGVSITYTATDEEGAQYEITDDAGSVLRELDDRQKALEEVKRKCA